MSMLRVVALLTTAAGIVFLARVGFAVAAELADGFRMPFIATAILASALGISLAILWVAISHLKSPSRRTALRLAAVAATSVCFVWPRYGESGGAGLIAAILLYFLVFRPAATAAFPSGNTAP